MEDLDFVIFALYIVVLGFAAIGIWFLGAPIAVCIFFNLIIALGWADAYSNGIRSMSEIKDRVLAHLSPETWCKYNATVDTKGPKAGKCCLNGHLVIAGVPNSLEDEEGIGGYPDPTHPAVKALVVGIAKTTRYRHLQFTALEWFNDNRGYDAVRKLVEETNF